MKKDGKMKPDNKKGFPGVLLLLVIGLVVILAFQNLSDAKSANVSFSYQLEHLVNLDLLDTNRSKKVALNDSLVSFHGVFKDKITENGRDRYRFLSLLNQHHEYEAEKAKVSAELDTLQKRVIESATYFIEIVGIKIPKHGFVVLPKDFDNANRVNSIVIDSVPSTNNPTFFGVQNQFSQLEDQRNNASLDKIGNDLLFVIQELRSSQVGIGSEPLKKALREAQANVEKALLRDTKAAEKYTAIQKAIAEVNGVVKGLLTENEHVKLYELRDVRSYLEYLSLYETLSRDYANNLAQLDRARLKVTNTIWFFNNKEVSTKALEKKSAEEYSQWYVQAHAEWEAFAENKGLAFGAPDQPRTAVLEKTFKSEEPAPNYFNYLFTFLPIILVGMLLYFIFSRQMKGGGSSAMSFGKSPAKMLNRSTHRITFDDVAGIDEAKEELEEIVDFLKDPQRYTSLGAKIPKGLLLIGSPGTGKTLVAKAVAGEAGVPFFSISGSDFVEMFVGVGASRVRDLFDQAGKNAPCIVFIDEIDAVGRSRGHGLGGGNDEREQTLNQLLVNMDGMEVSSGIIIIAATNRPDVLDPALLRPGRFDRRVTVDLPDVKGRLAILKVHVRNIKMDVDVDLKVLAQRTSGCSGADLANIVNEAALYAARKRRPAVTQNDLLYAQEKVIFGKERRSLQMEDEDKKTTAYHESGHALIALHLKSSDPVAKATILPRSKSLGATHFVLKANRVSYTKKELEIQLAVLMGGRVAESIINKDVTSGAQMDIKQATNIARSMVCHWGMSDKLGMINLGDSEGQNLMAGFQEREYSEETARIIDQEIKGLIDKAYKKAQEVLEQNRAKLDLMAEMLLKFETLEIEDLNKIMNGEWNPDEKQAELDAFNTAKGRREPPPPPSKILRKKKLKDNPAT